MRPSALAVLGGLAVAAVGPTASAAETPEGAYSFAPEPPEPTLAPERPILEEAPPPRPRRRGLVLGSTLGVLGFAGKFSQVSPPAYWLHAQLGYELTNFLMVLAAGEVALTDTSVSQDESHTRAYALWGFGGGLRATLRVRDAVALTAQAEAGVLSADVPHNALRLLGFAHAETQNPSLGLRMGVDWYQPDPHFALSAEIGGRSAQGFAKAGAASDFPLLWDAGAGVRYTF